MTFFLIAPPPEPSGHHQDSVIAPNSRERQVDRFAADSSLEGTGFKPSVPREGTASHRRRNLLWPFWQKAAPVHRDSALEEMGFEPAVPPTRYGIPKPDPASPRVRHGLASAEVTGRDWWLESGSLQL
jgi:hypothetical protein